jgi:hypothetical protein
MYAKKHQYGHWFCSRATCFSHNPITGHFCSGCGEHWQVGEVDKVFTSGRRRGGQSKGGEPSSADAIANAIHEKYKTGSPPRPFTGSGWVGPSPRPQTGSRWPENQRQGKGKGSGKLPGPGAQKFSQPEGDKSVGKQPPAQFFTDEVQSIIDGSEAPAAAYLLLRGVLGMAPDIAINFIAAHAMAPSGSVGHAVAAAHAKIKIAQDLADVAGESWKTHPIRLNVTKHLDRLDAQLPVVQERLDKAKEALTALQGVIAAAEASIIKINQERVVATQRLELVLHNERIEAGQSPTQGSQGNPLPCRGHATGQTSKAQMDRLKAFLVAEELTHILEQLDPSPIEDPSNSSGTCTDGGIMEVDTWAEEQDWSSHVKEEPDEGIARTGRIATAAAAKNRAHPYQGGEARDLAIP